MGEIRLPFVIGVGIVSDGILMRGEGFHGGMSWVGRSGLNDTDAFGEHVIEGGNGGA